MKNMNSLKGNAKLDRMKNLMGVKPLNESKGTSTIEISKLGPDNIVYGIVKENHEYYIKTSKKIDGLVVEDFQYIGGLPNKKDFVYESYSKALKKLNLKMISLNEQFEGDAVNVFKNDNLVHNEPAPSGYDEFEEMFGDDLEEEDELMELSPNRTKEPFDSAAAGYDELARLIRQASKKAPGLVDKLQAVLIGITRGAGASIRNEGELKVGEVFNDGPKELDDNTTGEFEDVTDEPDDAPNDKDTGTIKSTAKEATPKKTIKENLSILDAMAKMDLEGESTTKKKSLAETKYKLKLDDPTPESKPQGAHKEMGSSTFKEPSFDEPEGEEPEGDVFVGDEQPAEAEPTQQKDDPFDRQPFDAEVEADENEDPKTFIQQLSGKIGQSLRKYSEENGVDLELEKFAINSLISASHTSQMDSNDQEDIINKVKDSGSDSVEDEEEKEDFNDDIDTSPMGTTQNMGGDSNPASEGGGMSAPMGESEEEEFYTLPKEHKQVFKNAKLGVTEGFDDFLTQEEFQALERELGLSNDVVEEDSVEPEILHDDETSEIPTQNSRPQTNSNEKREKSLNVNDLKDKFADVKDNNQNNAIKGMMQDYMNTQHGFSRKQMQDEATTPEVEPMTKPAPVKVPKRRQPYKVRPNVSPKPKANNDNL